MFWAPETTKEEPVVPESDVSSRSAGVDKVTKPQTPLVSGVLMMVVLMSPLNGATFWIDEMSAATTSIVLSQKLPLPKVIWPRELWRRKENLKVFQNKKIQILQSNKRPRIPLCSTHWRDECFHRNLSPRPIFQSEQPHGLQQRRRRRFVLSFQCLCSDAPSHFGIEQCKENSILQSPQHIHGKSQFPFPSVCCRWTKPSWNSRLECRTQTWLRLLHPPRCLEKWHLLRLKKKQY